MEIKEPTVFADFADIALKNTEEAFLLFKTRTAGLSQSEVTLRQGIYGANALNEKTTSWVTIFLRQFKSAFVYLLLAACAVSLFQGEYVDAGMVFLFLFLNAVLGFYQEFRAEKALSLLKTFVDRKTRVRRDGVESLISVNSIVPGDIVLLDAGDMLPGDGYFIRAEKVTVDESPLTGETEPIAKSVGALGEPPRGYYGATNIGFTRTTLLSGDAEVLIFATGAQTVIGDIAKHMQEAESPSAFEDGISKFSKFILKLVLGTIPLIFVLNYFVHGDEFDAARFVLFSIALTVSVIPEALPLVMTISLSRGALNLAKKHIVPRRLSAIEDLGSIDVLCTDKTGTITENKLAVSGLFGNKEETLRFALMVPLSAPGSTNIQNSVFDTAIIDSASSDMKKALPTLTRIDELPFDPIRRRDSVLIDMGGQHALIMRGSPEVVYKTANAEIDAETKSWIETEGSKGCRVIAVAWSEKENWITQVTDETERGVRVVGLISFADPLKSSTREAVREATKLGVQVKIITGDAREVGAWVGCEAGIITDKNEVITGDELDRMTPEQKIEAVDRYHVFARTMPLQKTEIIMLLQKRHLVGFLGEGFNDAPALKMAHVGLAVANASDIAQDASDLVLLNPSLMVIIDGVKEGRKIFANSMKYLRATLASNFGNFFALAFSSLFIPYLPMLPIQVLLLNLLSDFPMMTIATDNVDDKELEKPKGYKVTELTSVAIVLGVVSTMFDFAFFGYFQQFGESVLQTMWFAGSIITELIIVFSIRTTLPFWKARRPANSLIFLSIFVMTLTVGMLYIPKVQEVFHFIEPGLNYLIPAGILIGAYFITTEIVKLMFYRLWKDKDTFAAGLVTVK